MDLSTASEEIKQMSNDVIEEAITELQEENKIDVSLLISVKKLIDAAIARGAYKPEELEYVGGVYNKFVGVIPKSS